MVSNSWAEMAMQVVQILTDANVSRELRASAREFALANLSADVVYRELDAHFAAACRGTRSLRRAFATRCSEETGMLGGLH